MQEIDFNQSAEARAYGQRTAKEVEFPSEVEARFDAVFAAIGNSEAKILTLLALSKSLITQEDLYRRFSELSGGIWHTQYRTVSSHCEQSLIPIGLVAQESFIKQGSLDIKVGFRTTESGEKYGKPIAAYLLEKSRDLPYSLYILFGPTQKTRGETRSVTTRAHILEELSLADRDLIIADIAKKLGVRNLVVSRHLKHLKNLGLVELDSLDRDLGDRVKYRLSEKYQRSQVETARGLKTLTQEVADILFETKEVDYELLFHRLKSKHTDVKDKNLRSEIYGVLRGLAMQGICQKVKYRAGNALSRTKITENGRAIVNEIILPIKRALSGDEELLNEWQKINWESYVKDVLAKYLESSGYCNRHAQEERTAQVLLVIKENIDGIRPKKIKSLVGFSPSNHLKFLLDQHLVIRKKQVTREGRGTLYIAASPRHLN